MTSLFWTSHCGTGGAPPPCLACFASTPLGGGLRPVVIERLDVDQEPESPTAVSGSVVDCLCIG